MPAAPQILSNAKLWVGGYDLSGDVNAIALKYGAEMKEKTTFGSGGFRERLPGVQFYSFQHEGYWTGGTGNVDDAIFNAAFGLQNTVMTIDGQGAGAEGDIAYTGQVAVASYAPGAKHGDVLAFSVSGDSDGDVLVRGKVLVNGTKTSTSTGTIFNLGAVSSTQKVYAALHVLDPVSGSSPTLDVVVQSAALVGFGSPSARITFTQATAKGAQFKSTAGAITDAFWRVSWTIGGTSTPTFPFVVVVGIR